MKQDASLFPGETVIADLHHPVLAWHSPGDAAKPLLVLAPGGGHLARVYYGHPGGEPRDFLAHWLARQGYEVLALSYASDHPANRAPCQEMTVAQWAEDFAAAAAKFAAPGRDVVLVAWSMAGRIARLFRLAVNALGLRCEGMVSLAATPPLPELTSPASGGEPLTPEHFWDSEARGEPWRAAIAGLRQPCGRVPIPADDYARRYRCNNPVGLRAEPRTAAPAQASPEQLLTALRPFDYADYPLVGAVIPTCAADGRHAMTDRMSWGFLNAQMLFCEADRRWPGGVKAIPIEDWESLRDLARHAADGLSREVGGDHFFFIGEAGASDAAAAIHTLIAAMEPVRRWRAVLPSPVE